ncbi:hypothetical protein HOA92_05515 [archaeon]|jgi:hypothetical protein|nr:hypothetical protein [archaeon]MBT6762471.1 hypothetical protein [archaeon]
MADVSFIDAESYQGGGKYGNEVSFKSIVMRQMIKISDNSNVEFRGGFWEQRSIVVGNTVQTIGTYVPDSREIYSNSVLYLSNIVFPHADKELREVIIKSRELIKEALTKYSVEVDREDENIEQGKTYDRKFEEIKDRISFRAFRRAELEKLFVEISCFLKRIDYFDSESFEEGV